MAWRLGLFLVFLLAGCGRSTSTGPADQAPPLTKVNASQLRQLVRTTGTQVVLVNMWATWCGPCREEFPELVKLQRDYQERGLRVLFVSWDAEAQDAREFLARQGVTTETFHKDGAQSDTGFVEMFEPKWTGAFPTTMIYDMQGKLREIYEGKRTYAEFEQGVRKVLNRKPEGES